MAYNDARVRHVGGARRTPGGDYVLYWMQAYRRLESNHALDEALRRAEALGRPLVVYEGLRLDYPCASARLHRFALEGMRDNRAAAARLGLTYWPFVEGARAPARGLLRRLAARAALVVTDDFPCFVVPGQTTALAAGAAAPVIAVDGNGVVPLSLLGAPAAAAAHLRPRIHRAFAEAWAHRAARHPRVGGVAGRAVTAPFPLADLDDLDRLMADLPLDASVAPVAATPGGTVAAKRRLAAFAARGLAGVAEGRSHPAPPGTARASGLSPYLHFGHISIETVVERVLRATGRWSPAALRADAVGRRADFFTRDARRRGLPGRGDHVARPRLPLALAPPRRRGAPGSRAARVGPAHARRTPRRRARVHLRARGVGGRRHPRLPVERGAARARGDGHHPQLPPDALGQEGHRVVAQPRGGVRDPRPPQQPLRAGRTRPELLDGDPVVLRPVRPALGAGAAGAGRGALHVLGEHRAEVPARALPRLGRVPAPAAG